MGCPQVIKKMAQIVVFLAGSKENSELDASSCSGWSPAIPYKPKPREKGISAQMVCCLRDWYLTSLRSLGNSYGTFTHFPVSKPYPKESLLGGSES
jgi:hypothetical protein